MKTHFGGEDATGVLHIAFEGAIGESAEFPTIPEAGVRAVLIDGEQIASIDAAGARAWLKWVESLSRHAIQLMLVNCSPALIERINTIDGFIPGDARVESFYVPYACETCDRSLKALFTMGEQVQITQGEVRFKFDAKSAGLCTDASCEPVLEVNARKYFHFLSRKSPGVRAAS